MKKKSKKKIGNRPIDIQNDVISALDKKMKEKNKGGRPTLYNEELGNRICDAVKNTVRGLDFICKSNKGFPDSYTVRDWLFYNKFPAFTTHYYEAKRFQSDCMADEIMEVSYNAQEHERTGGVDKAKLQVGALQWVASHLRPKKWGDKVVDDEDEKEKKRQMTETEIADKLNSVLDKAIQRKNDS